MDWAWISFVTLARDYHLDNQKHGSFTISELMKS